MRHEFMLAKRLLPQLKPDFVVLFTGVDEGMSAEQFKREELGKLDRLLAEQRWGEVAKHLDQARFLQRHSALMRLWDYRIKAWFVPRLTKDCNQVAQSEPPNNHPIMRPYVLANMEHKPRAYLKFIREQEARPSTRALATMAPTAGI